MAVEVTPDAHQFGEIVSGQGLDGGDDLMDFGHGRV
jgi:hypothetical protein